MPQSEITSHPLYSSFPEGWTTKTVGPVLIAYREPKNIRIEDYSYITLGVLKLDHQQGIVVTLEEKEDGDFAFVSCNIQAENGRYFIRECYDIALKIDRFFEGLET